ncbi:hypothetical protein BJ912DRAFT_987057 [Pholiota molesta]|nr:hypothetical protein BJ912DRAFT_987057 [Pholiota molesta]
MHLGRRARWHRAGPSCATGASRRWACVHRGYGWTDGEVSLWSTVPLCPTAALVGGVLWCAVGRRALRRFTLLGGVVCAFALVVGRW